MLPRNCIKKVYSSQPLYGDTSTQLFRLLLRTGRVGNCDLDSCRCLRVDVLRAPADDVECTRGGDWVYEALDPGIKAAGGPGAALYGALYVVSIGPGATLYGEELYADAICAGPLSICLGATLYGAALYAVGICAGALSIGPGATLYGDALYVVAIGCGPLSAGGTQLLSRSPLILPRDGSDVCAERRRAQDRLVQDMIEETIIIRMIPATTVTGMDIWRFWVYHAFAVFSALPC